MYIIVVLTFLGFLAAGFVALGGALTLFLPLCCSSPSLSPLSLFTTPPISTPSLSLILASESYSRSSSVPLPLATKSESAQ